MRVEVLRPKELDTHPGDEIVSWAREQVGIARSILDNPGGGLVFATQTIGQVRAGALPYLQRCELMGQLLDL